MWMRPHKVVEMSAQRGTSQVSKMKVQWRQVKTEKPCVNSRHEVLGFVKGGGPLL